MLRGRLCGRAASIVILGPVNLPYKQLLFLLVLLLAGPTYATTWFVRADGGTRYSAKMPNGQCDGRSDVAYPGSGSNRHCAYNDVRYLWDDDSGQVYNGAWVIAGGDTVVIRGCHALATQQNVSNPDCRIGWDRSDGGNLNNWCRNYGNYHCYNPPIPAGTAARHTRILGACAYEAYSCTPIDNNYPYKKTNETQLFGGFGMTWMFDLSSTQYVDLEGLEFTTHNGRCTRGGAPGYPRNCSSDQPYDDFVQNGLLTDNKTANLTLQDVYIHGFNASGLYGPIGGPINLLRVFSGFNGFGGWNFDDQVHTPDGSGSSISAKYVTMIGNGCYEEYPITHPFPAHACYDDVSGGFGDAWSGQDTNLDSFVCDHCLMAYNTKDAFLGPHTLIKNLLIENSQSFGNMGAQWKWNNTPSSTTNFIDNVTVGDCSRMGETVPGAAQSFALSSGRGGAYLSDFCRAGGNTVAINTQENSTVSFTNNTFIDDFDTVLLFGCGPASNNRNGKCGSSQFILTNNIFLGYTLKGQEAPGLFYIDDHSIKVVSHHNIEYGNRASTGDSCGGDILCVDPKLVNEPRQQDWSTQTFLDYVSFIPTANSPAVGKGTANKAAGYDFFGTPRPNPPSIGAMEPRSAQNGSTP